MKPQPEDDEPPPLEDLSEQIEAALNLKQSLNQVTNRQKSTSQVNKSETTSVNSSSSATRTQSNTDSVDNQAASNYSAGKGSESKKEFAGMSKGFLFGGGATKKKTSGSKVETSKPRKDEMPVIKSQPQNSSLKFEEVKDAQTTPNWINDSLLDSVSSDNTLMQKLSDPKYTKVLEEFQRNPKAAMEKYKEDKEVAEFFKSFMGIFGDHFSKLNPPDTSVKEEPTPLIQEIDSKSLTQSTVRSSNVSSADERKMKEILDRPQVKEALKREDIQKLFQLMRNDPEEGQHFLFERRSDPQFQKSVRVLCENGLMQFAG